MKFTPAQYEQLFSTYTKLLELLVESKSHVSASAAVALQNFKTPNFKDDYWPQFPSQFRKILAAASRYTTLDGEVENIQVEVRRILPVLNPVEPLDFLVHYKKFYLNENSDTISKGKLRDAIQSCLENLDPQYRYVERHINDYDAQFDLVSVDKKRTLMVDLSLDKKDQLQVIISAKYQDEDFNFDIDEVKFDMLQFQSLPNCITYISDRIALNVSMKVNGTRFRIGSMVFVMTGRDLQKVRANIISQGSGIIYSQQGDIVKVSTTNEGKVVDKVAQRLITQNSKDKLYYLIVPEETADAATASPKAEQELLV